MKRSIIVLFLTAVASLLNAAEAKSQMRQRMSGEAILKNLTEKSDEELSKFISFLDYDLDKSGLSDEELDAIIERLLVIQEKDPYKTTVQFKGPPHEVYPNRHATRQCVFRFRLQKIANGFRKLPMKERIAAITECISHPPKMEYLGPGAFSKELVVAGADAVPFIVKYKPVKSFLRRQVVQALEEIGDPRGIDYIIEVLQTPAQDYRFERPIAAKALAKFEGNKVIQALIAALKDETSEQIDRHLPQAPSPTHKPYIGRCYTVQLAAAESLTSITKKNWGLLFNEDFQTWSAWLSAKGQPDFDPRAVRRSPEDLVRLVRFLFHRYMSARPNPWQPHNSLESAEACRSLAGDLKSLGVAVVPLILDEYRARLADTPIWEEELARWTKQLLNALEWKEAKQSAEKI